MDAKRERIKTALAEMDEARQSFMGHWQDIADFICPRQMRSLGESKQLRGYKANHNIIDSTATLAHRAFGAAFAASVTPPSRPWKKNTTNDPALKRNHSVASYLAVCDEMMDEMILRSNFYQEMAKLYLQLGAFGTAVMLIEEDFERTFHCETLPVGSYWLATNYRGEVDTFMRKLNLTASKMVAMFGTANVSEKVRNANADPRRRNTSKFEVHHFIGPNTEYEGEKYDAADKAYVSCYIEMGCPDDAKPLRESGFDELPFIAPRWSAFSDDAYGQDCPGMMCLRQIKALQHGHKQIAKALDKQVSPPLQAPESTRRLSIETIPDSVNIVDSRDATSGVRPLYQVNFDISGTLTVLQDHRQLIRKTFFEDLFLMVANERRSGTKAREIDELHEEKMLILSSAYEQISNEALDPALNRMYAIANRLGRLPEPPPDMAGKSFSIEYVSVMAHAMKLVGIGNMDRALAMLGQVGAARPEVLDLLNFDEYTLQYLERLGVDPRTINSPEVVEQLRNERAQQIQQQQQSEQAQMSAETAKTMSETKIAEDTALDQLMNNARGMP